MTLPNTSSRRRTATAQAGPASRSAGPEASDPLQAALRTTLSRWWEIDHVELARLRRPAAEKQAAGSCGPWEEAEGPIALVDQARVAAFLDGLAKASLPCAIDYRLMGPAGLRWVRHTVLHRGGSARALRYTGIITDITAYKDLEAETLQISERVQNRIGQELHDDLCQVLAGLSCLTRVLENRLAPQLPHEVENLREINRQLVDAMERTRALTHGLYPAKMRSGDARSALLELAKQVEVRFGVGVRTIFRGRFPAHTAHEILQVYRIAQESISNAIRHGHAKHIELTLERTDDTMRLEVLDDGLGFPADEASPSGIGLQIMRHRAAQLSARIAFGNAPRRGALVVLHYQPLALL